MTATVRVTARSGESAGRASVPLSAVYREEGRDSVVWVVSGSTAATVTRQPVTLGTIRGGSVEITSGLKGGERIVVAGVSRLREGLAVRDLGDALGGRP